MALSCPLGITRCIPQENAFLFHKIYPLLNKFVWSRSLDIGLVSFFCLCVFCRGVKNSMILRYIGWLLNCGFVFFAFSIRQLIPENQFSDPTEWGWLNPTGGAFSTVADFAKVTTKLRAVTLLPLECYLIHNLSSILSRYRYQSQFCILTLQH